ncbi:MAG: 30S ribosomal protein S13 [Planctomycetota bacterium]|jgi:small subunit ribosomal protein S13
MPRVCGVDIPGNKALEISLTYIHGVGKSTAEKVLQELDINPRQKAGDTPDDVLVKIAAHIEKTYMIEGHLKRQVAQNIVRLRDIRSYRGFRHRMGLPARGQKTRNNARTRKGPKRTVAGKKKVGK